MLDFILSGLPREEVVSHICEYLRSINEKMQKNELGIEQYIITKALTKAPHEYTDAKNQPHVQVAKAMLEQGQTVAQGAVIEYVVCIDQVSLPLILRDSKVGNPVFRNHLLLRISESQVISAWLRAKLQ